MTQVFRGLERATLAIGSFAFTAWLLFTAFDPKPQEWFVRVAYLLLGLYYARITTKLAYEAGEKPFDFKEE